MFSSIVSPSSLMTSKSENVVLSCCYFSHALPLVVIVFLLEMVQLAGSGLWWFWNRGSSPLTVGEKRPLDYFLLGVRLDSFRLSFERFEGSLLFFGFGIFFLFSFLEPGYFPRRFYILCSAFAFLCSSDIVDFALLIRWLTALVSTYTPSCAGRLSLVTHFHVIPCFSFSVLRLQGFTTYAERRIVEVVQGEERAALNIGIGWSGLKEEMERFKDNMEFTKLRTNQEGINPDEIYSRVPYEKGFQFLWRIERQVTDFTSASFYCPQFLCFLI